MQFQTTNNWPAGSQSSFQGYLYKTYDDIAEKLGDSEINDGYKTDAEWWIQFEDGTFATIYNYKDGVNYNGTSGLSIGQITEWHIGGGSKDAVDRVHKLFGVE